MKNFAETPDKKIKEAARKAKEEGKTVPDHVAEDPVVYKVKKTKNTFPTRAWRL